jgi:hypothetical protein
MHSIYFIQVIASKTHKHCSHIEVTVCLKETAATLGGVGRATEGCNYEHKTKIKLDLK